MPRGSTDLTVYFATNRNPVDADDGYFGTKPNDVARSELRFGEVRLSLANRFFRRNGRKLREKVAREVKRGGATVKTYGEQLRADPPRYGSVRLFERLKGRMDTGVDTLVYIHGYSVSFADAIGSAMTLTHKFAAAGLRVQVVAFSWPSDGKKVPKRVYTRDREDAEGSADAFARGFLKLRDFVADIGRDERCNGRIHLMCHSMGNYVLENTMRCLGELCPGSLPRIFHEIISVAADVDHDVFDHDHKLGRLPELGRRVSVYFNDEDLAMDFSEQTKGNPRRLGHSGPRFPRNVPAGVFNLDASGIVSGTVEHHYHLEEIVPDLTAVLGGTRQKKIGNRVYEPATNTFFLGE